MKAHGLSARLCPQQLLRNSAQPLRAPAAGDIAQETTGSAAQPEISKNEKHPLSLQRMRVNRAKDEGGEIKGIVPLAAGSPRRWDGTRTALVCKVNEDNSLVVLINIYFERSPAHFIQYLINTEKNRFAVCVLICSREHLLSPVTQSSPK